VFDAAVAAVVDLGLVRTGAERGQQEPLYILRRILESEGSR